MLKDSTKNGDRASGRGNKKPKKLKPQPATPTLAQIGITKSQSSRYQKMAAIPDATFESAIANTKEVVGMVTSTAMLQQCNPKKEQKKPEVWADHNTPVVIPPDKPRSSTQQIGETYKAIETLATTEIAATALHDAMLKEQRYRITDQLDAALAYLTTLKKHWRHHHEAGSGAVAIHCTEVTSPDSPAVI